MSDEAKVKVANGVPTLPAVRKILEMHGELNPGDVVTYDDLSECIMEERDTNRWKGVVTAWRAGLRRDNNIMLACVPNVGYRVLNSNERINVSGKRYGHGVRRIVIAGMDARTTDSSELDAPELKTRDFLMKQAGAYVLAEKTRPKKLL
jgi:hypothetical protein